ncbi:MULTISPECIES: PAS domain-containing sensor histidine kinase [unclassified Campylobacter]|uniref:PAS domain-containing sensor histidine kinase n=1 Tax=unclassified Campylobacter TaxID=2593542 RepID=UPI003D33AA0F
MDDIRTKFKQYQDAIERSNIVSKTDIHGIITFVNDEFCKMSGYTREELVGKNHNIVRHPDVPSSTFKELWATILSKKVFKTIAKNLAKDGSVVYLNTTISPILNSEGEIEEFVAIRHDVTQIINLNDKLLQKESELITLNQSLEQHVREKTAELRELNENLQNIIRAEIAKNEENTKILLVQSRLASMGEMIANIAHQWRQPLNELSITLFKIKKNAQDLNELEKLYERCKDIIKSMSNTIEDFRGFFSSDKVAENFSLKKAVDNAKTMLQGTFSREGIAIKVDVKKDVLIYGYESQLTQVLINLLNNAKDALVERLIEKRLVIVEISSDSEFGFINVIDNAGGVKDEVIDKIFEPYFTTKHSSQGTGIGLYMSKMIIDRFKGELKVMNVKNGACFSIKLPLKGDEIE